MLALLSSAAMLLTVIAPAASPVPLPELVQPAPVTAPVNVQSSARSAGDDAIELQMQLRVLMPALSGDGGG